MRVFHLVWISIFLSSGGLHAYTGPAHESITKEAMTFLANNKSEASTFLAESVGGQTFKDRIVSGAKEPDADGQELTNTQVQKNSEFKSYNFEAGLSKDVPAAVRVMVTGDNPFMAVGLSAALNASVFGVPSFDKIIEQALKAAVSQSPKAADSLGEFKRATQHTYVEGEGMFGNTFNDISIAPYSAETDYNLAVIAWKNGDEAEAVRRLGRVLHYVQDITVPHHASLDVNIPDVARAAVELVRDGAADIQANSSQSRYEGGAANTYMNSTFNQSALASFVPQLQNNNDIGRSIPAVVIGIRDNVRNSGWMGKVDGYSNGGLAKKKGLISWAQNLWRQVKEKVTSFTQEVQSELDKLKDALVKGVRTTAGNQLQAIVEAHLNSTYKYRNVNDDFTGAAAALVPVAIVETAKIVDRFIYDTQRTFSATQISVAGNQDGRLEVFYVGTDSKLYHNRQVTPNGAWAGEEAMGGSAKQVIAAQNQDGRLEVFYVGTDNKIYHNRQTKPNSGWSGQEAMGGSAKQLAAARNQDGRLEIFYIGTDDKLYHNRQTKPNSGWSGQEALGGLAKQLTVAQNQDGRLEIFYVGTDNKVYHNYQAKPSSGWSGEEALGGLAKQIAVAQNQDGRLEIFYVGTNDAIYHNWQVKPNSGWGGEQPLVGSAKQLAVAENQDGRLEIFYVGTNDSLYHNWQTEPNSGWAGEQSLGGAAKQIDVEQNKDGRLEVFYIGTNKVLYHNWQVKPNSGWNGEATLNF